MSFKGKTIVVTGGTRGIGAAIGARFAQLGGQVILTGVNSDSIEQKQAIAPDNIQYCQLDLSSKESLDRFHSYLRQISKIDVLINNAGINKIDHLDNIIDSDFDRIIDINLKAPFYLSRLASSLMPETGGRIVNIASIWSHITKEGRVSYIASKSGLAGLTRGLATDLASKNILVNTVSPGFVLTDLTRKSLSDEEMANLTSMIPMQRMAQPEEIAKLVTFLASEDNTYLTGQNIIVDGGFTNV